MKYISLILVIPSMIEEDTKLSKDREILQQETNLNFDLASLKHIIDSSFVLGIDEPVITLIDDNNGVYYVKDDFNRLVDLRNKYFNSILPKIKFN